MSSGYTCHDCGKAIAADIPWGLCAHCLVQLGLEELRSEGCGATNEQTEGQQLEVGPRQSLKSTTRAQEPGSLIEKPGDRIGRYRLLEEIGHGGCGVVYMAEQEEPVRRKVALKVIKLGMDTKQVVARFEAERQAIALMDHPNIAKVLDAGATRTGRPYFVMELVGGIKITDYCDQNNLTTRSRLDLFIRVCHAVQHAHQKGIIHRDIKPSNILVAAHDGMPLPKVIDFGIAKATQGRLTDQTVFTAFEQFIGTPAYMSPEQAQMGGLDVDTRSDIYSLGVLLYELLTGTTPFDTTVLLAGGLDEMRRTIREAEPVKPSTRLTQERAVCSVPPDKSVMRTPRSAIDKDLDWIVMKCLEKDRARRYETANGLARDIERHLSHEPVAAGPPGRLYSFRKLYRRNRVLVTAAAVITVVLIFGVMISTWQAVRATRAEQEHRQVARFLREVLKETIPAATGGRDTGILKNILDEIAARLDEGLAYEPQVEMELRSDLVEAYHDLGFFTEEASVARRSLELGQSRLDPKHPAIGKALRQLGVALSDLKQFPEAEVVIRQALALQWKSLGSEDLEVAESLNALGHVLLEQRERPQAEQTLNQALAMRRKLLGGENLQVAESLNELGNALRDRLAEAESAYTQALQIRRKLLGEGHPYVAATLNNLANVLHDEGRLEEAETNLQSSVAMATKRLGRDHPAVLSSLENLGAVYMDEHKLADAEKVLAETLTLQRMRLGDDKAAGALDLLVDALMRESKFDQAERLLAEILPHGAELQPKNCGLLGTRADFYARQGRWKEAMADAENVIAYKPDQHWHYFILACMLAADGDLQSYRQHCQRILTQFGDTKEPVIAEVMAKSCLILPNSGVDLGRVGQLADVAVTLGQGRYLSPWFELCKSMADYREGHYSSALERVRNLYGVRLNSEDDHLHFAAYIVSAMAHNKLGQLEEARADLAQGVQIAQSKLPSLESRDLGPNWWDLLIGYALMQEAKSLIEGDAKASAGLK